MEERILTLPRLESYRNHLLRQEKQAATVAKYIRDGRAFLEFAQGRSVSKELVMAYKQVLLDREYQASSINSMLTALNGLLSFLGWQDCRVKNLKRQCRVYCPEERELTRQEYQRLVSAAVDKPRLCLLVQTICATGIRVSELRYFTVAAVRQGRITVNCKGKLRAILLPQPLQRQLLRFAREQGIQSGVIFRSRSGRPLDRSNIWSDMKGLCQKAGVKASKVFPHNLRKLFARTFYAMEKDIAKLADILGHSSIETTRIYIMSTGREHRRKMERMNLFCYAFA